ncbi:hypothetical protein M9H77_21996 [Catharanthus roseus]|uniref:Uncharacterized protein n=1 Tax=Catharanthus roseus TaxID=4058 RepID=A0ACC0ARV3_CATRO|nr:hypothetical protein M9H77_21996 [Catharanthus roseus]
MLDPTMICEDPDQALRRSQLFVPSTITPRVAKGREKIIDKWKTFEMPSQTLAFLTLGRKGLNSYGEGQNRLDTLRSQPSWSIREEMKLESERERLLTLEEDY